MEFNFFKGRKWRPVTSLVCASAMLGLTAGVAGAADYSLVTPSTVNAVDGATAMKVKVGTSATGSGNKILVFTNGTGVLETANASNAGASGAGGIVTFPAATALGANDKVMVVTSDNKVSAPIMVGAAASGSALELALGIAGQTAAAGTNAVAILGSAKVDNYAGPIYIPVRSTMTGGIIPLQAEVVTGVGSAVTGDLTVLADNPFVLNGTGDGADADYVAGTIVITQSKMKDSAGNDLSSNNPLTIANAKITVGGSSQAQTLYHAAGTAGVDLVQVTNTKALFSGIVGIGGTSIAQKTDGLAIEKADAKIIVFVTATNGDKYGLNPTSAFVDYGTLGMSVTQGATVSKWDGAVFDTTVQKKLYINTDGQSFLAPTTAAYTTLTQILKLTKAEKAAAGIDDGTTTGSGNGLAIGSLKVDMLAGALRNVKSQQNAAVANLAVTDLAGPWVYDAKTRIDAGDVGNDGSAMVNSIDLYMTEPGTKGVDTAKLRIWADLDGDGLIDDTGATPNNEATDGDEILTVSAINVAMVANAAHSAANDIMRIDVLAESANWAGNSNVITPGTALRVRLMANVNRSTFFKDGSAAANYYEPFFGDQAMDLARYDLFDDRTTIDTTVPIDPDYSADYPDVIKMSAATYGLAVADKAPAGITELKMVKAQTVATSALVYVKLSEAATILDFDGTADAKLTSAAELMQFKDGGTATPYTGTLYRMKAGKLNDIASNGIVEGTNVESDVDGAAGTEFILKMDFSSPGITINTGTDTLEVMTWGGKILEAQSNSTLATDKKVIGAAAGAPSLPAVNRVVYAVGASAADIYFTTDIQAVNSNTDKAATAITELNDAFSVYDGSGVAYAVPVVVSHPASGQLTLTWSSAEKLATKTGLTIKYDPTQTNNATDEYAVIGHKDNAGAAFQMAAFTAQAVNTSNTATTADLNFDGYVDAIIINPGSGVMLDTSVTPAASNFSLSTSEWKDHNDAATAAVIVKSGQTVQPSSVEIVNHTNISGVVDQSLIVLKFDSTFDWNPDTTAVEAPKTDATGFATVSYTGSDIKEAGGAPTAAFYISALTDKAAPAILSGQRSADTIVLDFSEDTSDFVDESIPDNDDVSGFFVVKDSNGYIMDTTEWDLTSYTGLTATANTKVVITCPSETVAKSVGFIYISAQYADNTAGYGEAGIGGVDNIDDGSTRAGQSPFTAVTATPEQYQTYDSFTTAGTKVAISQDILPEFKSAVALFNNSGYYDQVLVTLTEAVTIANTAGTSMENNFLVSYDTDDNQDAGKEIHLLKPDSVELMSGGTKLLITLTQARQLTSAASNDVYPVKIYYTDNSSTGASTAIQFYQDSDLNYMHTDTVSINRLNETRTANPYSVEVSGAFDTNNFSVGGMEINAYEAYRYLSIAETSKVDIDFEYGPLNKVTKGAFGIQANGATDQCQQEGVYTGIHASDDINGVVGTVSTTQLKTYLANGYAYLHTDANADGMFDLSLSTAADSKKGSVTTVTGGALNGSVTDDAATDAVFLVKFTSKAGKDGSTLISINGPYGIKGNAVINQSVSENWCWWNGTGTIAGLATCPAGSTAVGTGVIPIGATTGDYRVVAQDMVGPIMGNGGSPLTNAQKVTTSRILDTKVVLVATDIAGTNVLLNGVTDDVAIDYNFWNYDGAVTLNPDMDTLFGYSLSQTDWNVVPVVVDKAYYSGPKAPATAAKYPDGTSRDTAKIATRSISDAVIGLDGNKPVIANNGSWFFTLDAGGVHQGQAKNLQSFIPGYGIALKEGAGNTIDADSIWFFGYNMDRSTYSAKDAKGKTITAKSYVGGAKLAANIHDFTEGKSDVRSSNNVGWNLIGDVNDIDLSAAPGDIDYAITFNSGIFDSWNNASSLADFTTITNQYNSKDTVGKLGKAYFVHTQQATK